MGNNQSADLSNLGNKIDAASDDPNALSAVREEIQKFANHPSKQAIYKLLQKELSQAEGDKIGKDKREGQSSASSETAGTSSSEGKSVAPGDSSKTDKPESEMVKESQSKDIAGTASLLQATLAQPNLQEARDMLRKPSATPDMGPPKRQVCSPQTPTETESIDSGLDLMAAPKDYRSPPPMAPKKKFLGEFRNQGGEFRSRSGTLDPSDFRARGSSFSSTKSSAEEPLSSKNEYDEMRARSYSFGGAELAMRNLKRPAVSSAEGTPANKSLAGIPYSSHQKEPTKDSSKQSSDDNDSSARSNGAAAINPKQINIRTCIDAIIESSVVRDRLTPKSNEPERRTSPAMQGIENTGGQYARHVRDDERQSPLRPQEMVTQVRSVLQRSLELGQNDGYNKHPPSGGGGRDRPPERINNEPYAPGSGVRSDSGHGDHNPISQLTAQVESVMKRHMDMNRAEGERMHHEMVSVAMRKQQQQLQQQQQHQRESVHKTPPGVAHPEPPKSPKAEMRGGHHPPDPGMHPMSGHPPMSGAMVGAAQYQQRQGRKLTVVPPIPQSTPGREQPPPPPAVIFPNPMQGFVPVQTPEGVRLLPAPFASPHNIPPPEILAKMQARTQEDIVRAQMEMLRTEHDDRAPPRQERPPERHPHELVTPGYDPRAKRPDYPMERPPYPVERHPREHSPADRKYNVPHQGYESRPSEAMHRSPRELSPHPGWNREPSLSPRERQVQEALRMEQQRVAELRMGQTRLPPKPRSPPDMRSMQEQMALPRRGEGMPYPPPRSSPHESSSHSSTSSSPHRSQYPSHSPRARSPYEQSRDYKSPAHASNVKDSPLDLTVKKDCSPSRPPHRQPGMYSIPHDKPAIPQGHSQEKTTVAHLFHETIRKQMEDGGQKSGGGYMLPPGVMPNQGARPPMFMQPHLPGPSSASQGRPGAQPQVGVAQITPQSTQHRAPPSRLMPPQHHVSQTSPHDEEMRHRQQLQQPVSPKADGALSRNGNPVSTRTSGTNILGNHSPNDILYLRCKLCSSTYGSLHSFRKHFSKAHGCEPVQDHVSIQTISATKNALAKVGDDFKEEKQDMLEKMNLLPSNVYYENQLARYKTERLNEGEPSSHRPVRVAEVHPVKPHTEVATVKPYTESKPSPGSVDDKGLDTGKELMHKKEQSTMKCLQCGQDFPTSDWGVFKRHVRAHERELPYECSACKTGFKELTEWRTHMSVTHSMKACVCRSCGAGFSHPSSLVKHVEILHKGIAEVEYKCLYCPRIFNLEADLTEHTMEHEKSRMEYFKSRSSDKSSSSSSSPINSPRDQSPMPEKSDKDGSPIPDPDTDIFRNRTRSFSTNKIAEEAQREQEMRPRCSSFASPFRHAFRSYLDRMVEEEHKKQCIDQKPEPHFPVQMRERPQHPSEQPLPTIHESPEQSRAKALKRKAELVRTTADAAKMAKLEARLGPPPAAPPPEDARNQRSAYTTRSIMEAMVETAVNNYHEAAEPPPTGNSNAFQQYPLQKFSNLPRASPTKESNESPPNVEAVTKDAFSNHSILSAAELAHRIIESRVKHFSSGDETPLERPVVEKSSPPVDNSSMREPSQANTASPDPDTVTGAGSLKNFIEDLVAAEVNSYDTSEIGNKPSILAQLGEGPKMSAPTQPPPKKDLPTPERRTSSSPGVAPDLRERTESFGSKFDKIRRHYSMKKTTEDSGPSTSDNTSRSASPARSESVKSHESNESPQAPVRHISAVDVVHATISQAFMSCSSSPKPQESETQRTELKLEKLLTEGSSKATSSAVDESPRSAAAAKSPQPEPSDINDKHDGAAVAASGDTNKPEKGLGRSNSPPAEEVVPPARASQPSQVSVIDPPSPFSDCSERNLQIVLPEDDEEDDLSDQHSGDEHDKNESECNENSRGPSNATASTPTTSDDESSMNEQSK